MSGEFEVPALVVGDDSQIGVYAGTLAPHIAAADAPDYALYFKSTGEIYQNTGGDATLESSWTLWFVHGLLPDGYDDEIAEIIPPAEKQLKPKYESIDGSAFSGYNFSINDEVDLHYHLRHSHKPNTGGFFHAHFLTVGTDTRDIKFQFLYAYAHGHNQQNYDFTGTAVSAVQTPDGTTLRHYVAEIAVPVLENMMEVDGVIFVILKRVTNGGSNNTDPVFVFKADMHYQVDRLATPNRSPDFYG